MEEVPNWLLRARGPILLSGETGTGKSTLAKFIHERANHQGPFIAVNLATLNENLIEGELFGHSKGSFTGAVKDKKGYFEAVGKGTLFLDEIGELSLSSQKKLLSLLEEKAFYRLGCVKKQLFQGKIIAATNKDLLKMVEEKSFREDLYYRLNIFSYEVAPIRVNKIKKINLIKFYFDKFRLAYKKGDLSLNDSCLSYLCQYDWPGNIREIKNCMEFMVNSAEKNTVSLSNTPKWLNRGRQLFKSYSGEFGTTDFLNAKSQFEKAFIVKVLLKNNGKINRTAKEMGISKTTLIAKVKKYDIKPKIGGAGG